MAAAGTAAALLVVYHLRAQHDNHLPRPPFAASDTPLRPALTLLALLSLAARPTFPYGFTLPVALTQDWGIGQDAAALATLVAWRAPWLRGVARRLPVPRAGAVAFLAFQAYALLAPPWAREWDGHPGNEPKYLRMAVALGHGLTLDVEGVSDDMERLTPRPVVTAVRDAAGAL